MPVRNEDQRTMDYEVKKYEKYKSDLKFMLVGSGLWPNFHKHPRNLRIFLSLCSGFGNGATAYTIINFCIHHISNINVLTSGLGLMISSISAFLKVCILRLHERDLQSLSEGISARFEKDLAIPQYRPYLLAHGSTFFKFFYAFDYLVALSVIILVLTPLLMLRHGKYVRSYPQRIPFDYEPGGALHWILYVFEVIVAFYSWSITVGVDSFFGFYALHMVGELRLLSVLYENLKTSKSYKKDIKECVSRHMLLMESQNTLQRVFGFLSILLAVTCAIVLCSIIFQVTQAKHLTISKIGFYVFYCTLKLIQAYSYSWYGNIITVESELCLNSIYNAHWPGSGDLTMMNDVIIISSQKPLIFKAKGCMLLRLDVFSKIVHTSVSYFFLLRAIDEALPSSS